MAQLAAQMQETDVLDKTVKAQLATVGFDVEVEP